MTAWDEEEVPAVTTQDATPPTDTAVSENGGEQLENPAGAGSPAGVVLEDPTTPAVPGAGDITLSAPAGTGLELPAFGLAVTDQPASYSPEDAAKLQDAAAAQGIELIEGGGS